MGDYTNVDLPFESNGRIDEPSSREKLHKDNPTAFPYPEWYTGYNLNMAVGQGDTQITPLQLANSYGTFVNGDPVRECALQSGDRIRLGRGGGADLRERADDRDRRADPQTAEETGQRGG